MTEIITVTGRGRASLPADRAVLAINLSNLRPDYGEALDLAAAELAQLRAELLPAGVSNTDLKTQIFNVQEEYESVESSQVIEQMSERRYKQVLIGFRYTHHLILELERDNARISQLIGLLSRSETRCEFNLRFKVQDERRIRELAAVNAVANAKAVAESLAAAAGLKLGDIRRIDYAFAKINVYSQTDVAMPRMMMAEQAAFKMDFAPEDIEQDEEVSIEFSLNKA